MGSGGQDLRRMISPFLSPSFRWNRPLHRKRFSGEVPPPAFPSGCSLSSPAPPRSPCVRCTRREILVQWSCHTLNHQERLRHYQNRAVPMGEKSRTDGEKRFTDESRVAQEFCKDYVSDSMMDLLEESIPDHYLRNEVLAAALAKNNVRHISDGDLDEDGEKCKECIESTCTRRDPRPIRTVRKASRMQMLPRRQILPTPFPPSTEGLYTCLVDHKADKDSGRRL